MTEALERIWYYQAQGADLSTDGLLLVAFAGCSLDEKPGSNWVQDAGGLPEYICQVARAIKRSGHTTSEAIQLAVGTVKNWASGAKHVNAETKAKAAAAVAEWEAKKASAHARKKVSTTNADDQCVYLCAETFNTETVQQAFRSQMAPHMFPGKADKNNQYIDTYSYVNQMWSNFLIATGDLDQDNDVDYYKIPFSVDPADQTTVTFGTPIEVKQEWVTADGGGKLDGSDDISGADLTDDDLDSLMKLTRKPPVDALAKFIQLAKEGGDKKPYGNVKYADAKNGKYPVDTEEHARAAWAYINKPKNASVYPLNGVSLSSVKSAIRAACKKFGIDISEGGDK